MDACPPEPVTPPPRIPAVSTFDIEGAQCSQIEILPPKYVYIHTTLPNTHFFNLDVYAKNYKGDKDFIPDLLTDKVTSNG